MKKIVPFNNVLQFNTDVKEITAISLEHVIEKYPDMISGVFYISGEYKITDGQLEKDKFNFELPFDIALSNNYNLDTLLVDIDDFRYDIISDKSLKVNIDLYIDGEEIEPPLPRNSYTEELPSKDIRNITDEILSTIPTEPTKEKSNRNDDQELSEEKNLTEEVSVKEETVETSNDILDELVEEPILEEPVKKNEIIEEPERIDLLQDMLATNKEDTMNKDLNININNDNDNENENINNNIFNPEQDEQYVTYRVYKVVEGDTLDSILTKYNITKEMISDYNNIENITPGDKLIIPTNEK